MSDEAVEQLINHARAASDRAYAPYSHFPVGAALIDGEGRIFTAVNVENASFGLSCCAERNAVYAMVAGGGRSVAAIAVYTPTAHPTRPCGACRQVLREFGPECLVVCAGAGAHRFEAKLSQLLPEPFDL